MRLFTWQLNYLRFVSLFIIKVFFARNSATWLNLNDDLNLLNSIKIIIRDFIEKYIYNNCAKKERISRKIIDRQIHMKNTWKIAHLFIILCKYYQKDMIVKSQGLRATAS